MKEFFQIIIYTSAAYYGLAKDKNEEYLVLTLDGYGDFTSATLSIGNSGKLKEISRTRWKILLGPYMKTTNSQKERE